MELSVCILTKLNTFSLFFFWPAAVGTFLIIQKKRNLLMMGYFYKAVLAIFFLSCFLQHSEQRQTTDAALVSEERTAFMSSGMVLMCHRVPPPAIRATIPITSETSIQTKLLREDAALRVWQVLGVSCWGWGRVGQFPCLQNVCSGTGPVLPRKCRKRSADCAVSKVRRRSIGSFSRPCSLKSQLYWRRIRWSVLIGLWNGKGWKPVTSENRKKAPSSPAYLQQTDAVSSQQMRV